MAKYQKSWGSVSTNFTKTQAPSSAARESKAAEDKYQKDMKQLRSMKEVASFDSQQSRRSAAMADKAATYELNALTKFSSTLDNFLRTDAAEMNAEREARDLQKHVDKFQSNDLKDVEEWNAKQKELETKIAAISENNAERQKLEDALEKHNLTSPNEVDPTKLSGNEKLAYEAVKAKSIIDNYETNYTNYIEDRKGEEVDAVWEDPIPQTIDGVETVRHRKVKIGEITDPKGKEWLKKEYFTKVTKENPMAGLKPEWKTLLLAGPLKNKLDATQAAEVQQYNNDQRRLRIEATEQTIFNWQTDVTGYNPQDPETRKASGEKHVNNLLQTWRNDGKKSGVGTAGNQLSRFSTQLVSNVTNETDAKKMEVAWENTKFLLGTIVTEGPNKGKTLQKVLEEQGGFDMLATEKLVHKAMDDRETRLDAHEVGQITESRLTLENQLVAGRNSGDLTVEQAQERILEWEKKMTDVENGGYSRPAARAAIFAKTEDPRTMGALKDSKQWEEKCKDLMITNNGVIPLSEVGFMPDSLRKELEEKYDWRFVRAIPGAENADMVKLTQINVNTLHKAIRKSEVDAGQKVANGDSIVMNDLANDVYHAKVQKYTIDEKMTPRQAATRALLETQQMIANGRTSEGKYNADGTENPFYSEVGLWTGAWGNSSHMKKHQARYLRLPTFTEQQRNTFSEKHAEASKNGKVNYKEDYLFTPVVINHSVESGKEGAVNLGSIRHLGINEPGAPPNKVMVALAAKAKMSPMEFVSQQRHAAIESTGGYLNSPLMKDPTLMKVWGTDKAEYQDEVKAEKEENKKRLLERRYYSNPFGFYTGT